MEHSNFAAYVLDGLMDPSPVESSFRVKNAVAQELEALDPSSHPKATGYFLHTFAPDFILTWPDKTERPVYLRTTYDMEVVAEDLLLIDAAGAMIVGLSAPTAEPKSLAASVAEKDALFTEPAAIEGLIKAKKNLATAGMVSNALAQGGRGVLTGDRPARLAKEVAAGFDGARQVQYESTAKAVRSVDLAFAPAQAARLTRVLQAVWEGSEGRLDSFPGAPDLSGRLNHDALQYLVKYMDSEDLDFWGRVGRSITIGDLAELDIKGRETPFNALVAANLDVIAAGAGALIPDALDLHSLEKKNLFEWTVREGRVAFEGPRFVMLLGGFKKDVEIKAHGPGFGISPETVIARMPQLTLNAISIKAGGEAISYSSDDGQLDPERLLGVAHQWKSGTPLATTAVAQSPSGSVNVDFTSQLAWRITNSSLLMADLVTTAVPLLHDLDEAERDALNAALAHPDRGAGGSSVELDLQLEFPAGGVGDIPENPEGEPDLTIAPVTEPPPAPPS